MNCFAFSRLPVPRLISATRPYAKNNIYCLTFFGCYIALDDKGAVAVIIFGFPKSRAGEDKPRRAVTTAMAIRSCCPSAISLRVGVSTGTIYCGNVGSRKRREYAAMGAPVILGARLMVKDKLTERHTLRRIWRVRLLDYGTTNSLHVLE